ncbi:AmmeMemoRadiSam system protein A [Treponema zuelzerae]|uniref:AmmeMemoRadiSam system protein A n=1 Tax=Teretinema zuelzerae TaxID=156 RepID=A0AAE3EHA2_9SPIR|nr:AmmeMemoRadiSam system protein A [Teretinema zuelzerae]MCD1654980.1 AmmeMemoRadiSam system protein A [Teretinema zuelzerae]
MKDRVDDRNGRISAVFLFPHPPVILREIGNGREEAARATIDACRKAAGIAASLDTETIVIISPHAPRFSDWIFAYDNRILSGTFERFGAPALALSAFQDTEYLRECVGEFRSLGIASGWPGQELMDRIDGGASLDHGVLVPLYWLRKACPSAALVAIAPAFGTPRQVWKAGSALAAAARSAGRRVCVIASGDLSHKVSAESPYGMAAEGEQFDRLVTGAFESGDFSRLLDLPSSFREAAAECGLDSLLTALGALYADNGLSPSDSLPQGLRSTLSSYEAPFGIGYAVAGICLSSASCSDPVRIARTTIESFVRTGNCPDPSAFLKLEKREFPARAGCFVSLKKDGALRGCIGTISPVRETLQSEIMRNAVSACSEDPRFDPVRPEELAELEISVDILSEPEKIASRSQLDPSRYGVIVSSGYKRGLLLPDLEGVDTVEEQLAIACRKAGIGPDEHFDMERFTVERHR